jgi:TatD DNase family protein
MIDTHAHLEGLAAPRAALARAWEAGVEAVAAVSMDAASGRLALELAAGDKRVWPCLGLHPWQVNEDTWQNEVAFVEGNLHQAAALGEVGLDYKKKIKKQTQQAALAAQLELAAGRGLTALVHCRYSERRVLHMLREAAVRAVFHWFAAPDLLPQVLEAGHFISATPSVASSPPHRAAIKACPLERLVLETDTPVAHGGTPTEPARVAEALRLVAELKSIPSNEVAAATNANAKSLFKLPLNASL